MRFDETGAEGRVVFFGRESDGFEVAEEAEAREVGGAVGEWVGGGGGGGDARFGWVRRGPG